MDRANYAMPDVFFCNPLYVQFNVLINFWELECKKDSLSTQTQKDMNLAFYVLKFWWLKPYHQTWLNSLMM